MDSITMASVIAIAVGVAVAIAIAIFVASTRGVKKGRNT